MTREQYLDKMAAAIGTFENASGRHYQSATESSWNTWNSGSGVGGDRNTTISYYNNGAMLGAMLDLKIRDGSGNRKSLDDVMRALYRKYYLEKKRGFTDAEFRAECESAAGGEMREIFEYAATTKEVNYAKYFALAGMKLESTAAEAPGAYSGLGHADAGVAAERDAGGWRPRRPRSWVGADDAIGGDGCRCRIAGGNGGTEGRGPRAGSGWSGRHGCGIEHRADCEESRRHDQASNLAGRKGAGVAGDPGGERQEDV